MTFRFRSLFVAGLLAISVLLPTAALAQPTPAPTPAPASALTAPAGSASAAPATDIPLSVPFGSKNTVSGLPEYIVTMYRYALGIVTVVAIIMVIFGGFQYLLGSTTGSVKSGQKYIQDALGGMVILFLAYVILYTINPKTVNLSLPGVRPITAIGITDAGTQTMSPGTSCSKDSDCSGASKCLRTSSSGGICADGVQNGICKCEGAGCRVTAEQAGGPVNNNDRKEIDCQAGLTCAEISNGHFVCNGGAIGSACNENASRTNSAQRLDNVETRVGAGLESAAAIGTLGVAGDLNNPFRTLPDATRRMIRCTQPGQFCFQPSTELAGACVYGDPRDTAMFNGIEEYRTNEGLKETVTRCELTETQIRAMPKALGGCKNLTNNNVDEFCMQHRYHCANGATCAATEYASQFASTIAQYTSLENVPNQLKPSWFSKQGCFKPVGAACASDGECSSKCLNNRCSGFGILAIDDSVRPGTLRFNELPTRFDQLAYRSRGTDCAAATWTAIDLLYDPDIRAANSTALDQSIIQLLFQSGTYERFACYPKRPTGSRCDFTRQCATGRCVAERQSTTLTLPATFSRPLENTAGLGTCT